MALPVAARPISSESVALLAPPALAPPALAPGSPLLGSTTPRLWTPPLRELTPDTSYGFDVIDFARDTLRHPLDPWEEFAVIHGGELLPDGRPRFRIVLILVARQNGKTELLVVLTLFWQFIDQVPLILGTSTKLDYSKESWTKARKLAEKAARSDSYLAARMPRPRWYREANGEQESWTIDPDDPDVLSRYKIAASNAEGGRSLTINRLILDELRQHHDYSAYDAAEPAASPMDAQIWALSNMGDDNSVVLNDLRGAAIEYIETGEGDPRLGLLEWSAPRDADPLDPRAHAMANPNLGRRLDPDTLMSKAKRAVRVGGPALTGFKTENLCIHVKVDNPAIEPAAWRRCHKPGDLEHARSRVALVVDVAPDQQHATAYAAALIDTETVRVDFVEDWTGPTCVDQLRRALPGLRERIKPRLLGWFPNGPAAALFADLRKQPEQPGIEEIRTEVTAVCMGFAEQIIAERIAHSDDPLLNAQIEGAERLPKPNNTWIFSRGGEGHVDAVYAAAGAAHLARTLPPPPPRPRVIFPKTPRAA